MNDIRRWIPIYVMGKKTTSATHRMFMSAMKPTGEGDRRFGLALGGSSGWYRYTGGLPGYNTSDYYFPSGNVTIVSWVTLKKYHPAPGVAGGVRCPGHVPKLVYRAGVDVHCTYFF